MKRVFFALLLLCFILTGCSFTESYDTHLPLPGETIANAQLQHDTLQPVYMTVQTKAPNCKKMKITNTSVTTQPYDLKYRGQQIVGGLWEELWAVKACSQTYYVPIKFILDETGASYEISPDEIITQ